MSENAMSGSGMSEVAESGGARERKPQFDRFLMEERFAEQIFGTAEVAILVLDRGGRIVRFNPYFSRIAGWPLSEVVGCDWFQLCIPSSQQPSARNRFLGLLETSLAEDPMESSPARREAIQAIVTQRGEVHEIRWSLTPLLDAAGRRHAMLAVGTDLSELLRAQARALQAERLAAIGQTITGLAHESRNALQRIQAGLEMLGLELGETPEQHRDLGLIQRATDDLHKLLEEVRLFAAPIHLHREEVSLPRLWRHVWQQLQARYPDHGVQFREAVEIDQPVARIDPLRIEQVFWNLFENSLAARGEGLQVCLQLAEPVPNVLQLTIADNGPGLTREQRLKIFEPFYTTKSSGTGLGMSTVQRIIEAHGGTIEIGEPQRSSEGSGTVLQMRVPRRPPQAADEAS